MTGQLSLFKGKRQRGTALPPPKEFALHMHGFGFMMMIFLMAYFGSQCGCDHHHHHNDDNW